MNNIEDQFLYYKKLFNISDEDVDKFRDFFFDNEKEYMMIKDSYIHKSNLTPPFELWLFQGKWNIHKKKTKMKLRHFLQNYSIIKIVYSLKDRRSIDSKYLKEIYFLGIRIYMNKMEW